MTLCKFFNENDQKSFLRSQLEVIVPSAVIFTCFLHFQKVEDVQLRAEVVEAKNDYSGETANFVLIYLDR